MYRVPEFHLETGVIFGMIRTEEDLVEALDMLKGENMFMFRIYAKPPSEYVDHPSFGTRREYDDYRHTLFEFLDDHGFDVSPWLQSSKHNTQGQTPPTPSTKTEIKERK